MIVSVIYGFVCFSSQAELAWTSLHQSVSPPPGSPRAEILFAFTNAGPKPVTITKVDASCDCIATQLTKRTFAPGEEGQLKVTFKTAGQSGRQSREIQVYTDEDRALPTTLRLDLTLTATYHLSPRLLRWSRHSPPRPQRVELTYLPGSSWKAPTPIGAVGGFELKVESVQDDARRFWIVATPESTALPLRRVAELQLEGSGEEAMPMSIILLVD